MSASAWGGTLQTHRVDRLRHAGHAKVAVFSQQDVQPRRHAQHVSVSVGLLEPAFGNGDRVVPHVPLGRRRKISSCIRAIRRRLLPRQTQWS